MSADNDTPWCIDCNAPHGSAFEADQCARAHGRASADNDTQPARIAHAAYERPAGVWHDVHVGRRFNLAQPAGRLDVDLVLLDDGTVRWECVRKDDGLVLPPEVDRG